MNEWINWMNGPVHCWMLKVPINPHLMEWLESFFLTLIKLSEKWDFGGYCGVEKNGERFRISECTGGGRANRATSISFFSPLFSRLETPFLYQTTSEIPFRFLWARLACLCWRDMNESPLPAAKWASELATKVWLSKQLFHHPREAKYKVCYNSEPSIQY